MKNISGGYVEDSDGNRYDDKWESCKGVQEGGSCSFWWKNLATGKLQKSTGGHCGYGHTYSYNPTWHCIS